MRRANPPPDPARRLRPVAATAPDPDASFTLATTTFVGATPPHVTTEVRPLASGARAAWEIIVKASGARPAEEGPRFAVRRARSRRRVRSAILDPARPPWIAFRPTPRLLPRERPPLLRHRGQPLHPLSIIGNDDRKVYQDLSYPWGCVCKVRVSGGRFGSGVLIGPRHVLTASHVLDWGTKRATVEVHRFDSFTRAVSPVVAVWAYEEVGAKPTYSNIDEDYAVLVLRDRLGDRFGYFGCRTYDSAWDDKPYWRNIGYAGNVSSVRPLYERDFHLDEDEADYGDGRAMTSGGDHCKGQSGGPIFAFWSGRPYVVAVVSADGEMMLSGEENWCSGGSQLTQLVKDARSGDP